MSLQLWLPLNGTNKQQGVSGRKFLGSPASWGGNTYATFSGSTSSVVYANYADWNYTDEFSFCFWICPNYTGSTSQYVFTCGRADYGGYGYGCEVISASAIRVRFGAHTANISVATNEWAHIAVTISGSTMTTYKNGAKVGTTSITTKPTYSDGNGFAIGCFHYSTSFIYPYYGSIRDFRVYDNVLSPKEIYTISKGLFLHWPLDTFALGGRFKGNIYDTSGFGHTGVLAGTLGTATTASARYGSAVNFTGSQYIKSSACYGFSLKNITISAWVKKTTYTGCFGVMCEIPASAHGCFTAFNNNFQWHNGSSYNYVANGTASADWCLESAVINNGTMTTYLNGVKQSSSALTNLCAGTDSNNYFAAGCDLCGGDEYYNGYLSDMRIYLTALTADDIMELYKKPIHITNNGTLMTQGEIVES